MHFCACVQDVSIYKKKKGMKWIKIIERKRERKRARERRRKTYELWFHVVKARRDMLETQMFLTCWFGGTVWCEDSEARSLIHTYYIYVYPLHPFRQVVLNIEISTHTYRDRYKTLLYPFCFPSRNNNESFFFTFFLSSIFSLFLSH